MQLTEAQKEQYLLNHGFACPICNGIVYLDGEVVIQPLGAVELPTRCLACGAKFTERLKLTDACLRT